MKDGHNRSCPPGTPERRPKTSSRERRYAPKTTRAIALTCARPVIQFRSSREQTTTSTSSEAKQYAKGDGEDRMKEGFLRRSRALQAAQPRTKVKFQRLATPEARSSRPTGFYALYDRFDVFSIPGFRELGVSTGFRVCARVFVR